MANKTGENTTLGFFVAAGVVVLVVSLYLIGKNQSMFGATFHLRARFENVNGLMAGNNIRFSGIQAGTVNKITVIDDTTIEVDLLIEKEMKPFIRDNAQVNIGNEGLMGNKVINIIPSRYPGGVVTEGSLLLSKSTPYPDDMMQTLSSTNDNVEVLSGDLVSTVRRINESKVLWQILNDTTLSEGLRESMNNLRAATVNINNLSASLNSVILDARAGRGTAGALIADDSVAAQLKQSITNINNASKTSLDMLTKLDSIVSQTQTDLSHGNGIANALLKDPLMVDKVNASIDNIQKGTTSFQESMEALKHNFLIRGYFKKQEKKKSKSVK
jgi:phospholipid/cholesterol/gamma-HCH transport system substrate-binding protein